MSAYDPPTQILSVFNPLYFQSTSLADLDTSYLNANYLKFPVAQGLENLQKTNITDTTQSTDATSGALTIAGGVGVAKNVNVGGTTTSTGLITATAGLTSPANIVTTGTGTMTSAGLITATAGLTSPANIVTTGTGTMTSAGLITATGGVTTPANIVTTGTGTMTSAGLINANGGFRGNRINLSAFTTPTDSFYGSYIIFNNTIATNLNQTIPNASGTGISSIIQLYSDTTVVQSITAGTSKFYGCGYDNSTTLKLRQNEIVSLRADGFNWVVFTDTNIIPARRTFISRKADGAQTIADSTETLILFATDNGSGSSTGIDYTNANGRFTNNRGCSVVCNISGTLSYALNGSGFRSVWINHSSLGRISISLTDATLTQPTCLTYSANIKLDDTEFFNIRGYQNSGAGIIVSGTTLHPTTCTVLINDTC